MNLTDWAIPGGANGITNKPRPATRLHLAYLVEGYPMVQPEGERRRTINTSPAQYNRWAHPENGSPAPFQGPAPTAGANPAAPHWANHFGTEPLSMQYDSSLPQKPTAAQVRSHRGGRGEQRTPNTHAGGKNKSIKRKCDLLLFPLRFQTR